MVDFGFRQGPSEFSTAGIARAMSRIENERERRRGPKDAVSGWKLTYFSVNIKRIKEFVQGQRI
jgi:hypothetical protein